MENSKREELKKLIDIAAGREKADLVIKNCKVIDVFGGNIIEGDIAFSDGKIAGIGSYKGLEEKDAKGAYASPGFIDSHIHIESSYLSPEELGKLLVPRGGTTIIADPHEIVNVCGLTGLKYMLDASEETTLDIKYMLPSCVPATPFENAGACLIAKDMEEPFLDPRIIGLGEFMDFTGIIAGEKEAIDKILVAQNAKKPIDGHSPGVIGEDLNAYASALIKTDHECSNVEEMHARIQCGMYVLLRHGSACHELKDLLKGVTPFNSHRCLLCSDDRQPKTISELGHIDHHLRICVEEGIDPIIALRMATINAAECYSLTDRGAITPGLRGDIVLFNNLEEFQVQSVFVEGKLVAEKGKYLLETKKASMEEVRGSFHVSGFSKERLKLNLKSNSVHAIEVIPGSVVTRKKVVEIKKDEKGEFIPTKDDIVKIVVVERHKETGNVGVGFLAGYGLKKGALALSIAHDSHNIIAVGRSDAEIEFAINELINQNGGIVVVENQAVLESMPMPIAGLMTDQTGEWVEKRLDQIHEASHEVLGISKDVEPVMTLCFMSLGVIPELKITDRGLFDVMQYEFIEVEA